jgi:hypothetical protein
MDVAVRPVVWSFFLLFVFALFGKLDGWRGWHALTAELPFPAPARLAVRGAVPLAEGAVALALALDFSLGLVLAMLLLGALALGVAALVPALGGKECNCFGAAVPTAIGYPLVARNASLALLAAAAWRAAPGHGQAFGTVDLALLPVIFVVALMLTELLRFRSSIPRPEARDA